MKKKYWALKIFIITLLVSAAISLVVELFLGDLELWAAFVILGAIIVVGVVFDIIGVAVSTCDETPLIAMSAKKIKKATYALPLLKKADIVANICNDVVGDICGIVSGATGAAIAVKVFLALPGASEMWVGIVISALISAATVGGKAAGKSYAMRKNKDIVIALGAIIHFFKIKK